MTVFTPEKIAERDALQARWDAARESLKTALAEYKEVYALVDKFRGDVVSELENGDTKEAWEQADLGDEIDEPDMSDPQDELTNLPTDVDDGSQQSDD